MKKLLSTVAAGAILAIALVPATTSHTSAQTANPTATAVATTAPTTVPTPAPTGPPVQGATRSVVMYVDTVQGAAGNPKPAVGCSQTNLFRRGQQVVFRMWGVNVKLGGAALVPSNTESVQVIIPGVTDPIPMNYGTHGTVSFWSSAWKTDANTPLGIVDFTVVVKTKAMTIKVHGKKTKIKSITSKFTQQGLAQPSRLTVTP